MKIFWLSVFALLPLCLCSCALTTGSSPANTSASASLAQSSAQSLATASKQAAGGVFSKADLIFTYKGVEYPLNSDAAPLLAAFGTGYKEKKAPSCAYVGEDKQFDYDFASIFTYPLGGKDLIDEIDFSKGEYLTNRNVGLGSTLDEVKDKYENGGFEADGMYIMVLSGNKDDLKSPKLYFEITDGVVTKVSYYAASNVQK